MSPKNAEKELTAKERLEKDRESIIGKSPIELCFFKFNNTQNINRGIRSDTLELKLEQTVEKETIEKHIKKFLQELQKLGFIKNSEMNYYDKDAAQERSDEAKNENKKLVWIKLLVKDKSDACYVSVVGSGNDAGNSPGRKSFQKEVDNKTEAKGYTPSWIILDIEEICLDYFIPCLKNGYEKPGGEKILLMNLVINSLVINSIEGLAVNLIENGIGNYLIQQDVPVLNYYGHRRHPGYPSPPSFEEMSERVIEEMSERVERLCRTEGRI